MKGAALWVALALTAVVIGLHGLRAVEAGPLWRDEAAAAGLATMPQFHDVVRYFPHEAFPLLFPATVRAVAAITGDNDSGWRAFGLGVGVAIVGALWLNLWWLARAVPLCALALLGFNGAFLQWGDSLRGYGMGTLFILLTIALVWRVVERPTRWRIAGAMIAAVASVQTLFHNPVLIFAICLGGIAVALRHRSWRQAGQILLIGAVAAASLLPYWALLRGGRSWDVVVRTPVTLGSLLGKLTATLSASGWSNAWLWAVLFLLALVVCVAAQFGPKSALEDAHRRDLLLFCGTALVVGVVGHFCFLRILSYVTRPWYYLALLGFCGALLDVVLTLLRGRWGGCARLVLALIIAATSLPLTWEQAQVRQSNVDLVAVKLEQASREDVIVVTPWYKGISFARYYRGAASWLTLPPVDFLRFHRFDLYQAQMALPDPELAIAPVLEKVNETLKGGHRVWVVGPLETAMPDPALARAATDEQQGAEANERMASWSIRVATQLRNHALHTERVGLEPTRAISSLEDLRLSVFEGWSGSP